MCVCDSRCYAYYVYYAYYAYYAPTVSHTNDCCHTHYNYYHIREKMHLLSHTV